MESILITKGLRQKHWEEYFPLGFLKPHITEKI